MIDVDDTSTYELLCLQNFKEEISPSKQSRPLNSDEIMRALADADVAFDYANYSKFA